MKAMNIALIFVPFFFGLLIAFLVDKSFGLHPAYAYVIGFAVALIATFFASR